MNDVKYIIERYNTETMKWDMFSTHDSMNEARQHQDMLESSTKFRFRIIRFVLGDKKQQMRLP